MVRRRLSERLVARAAEGATSASVLAPPRRPDRSGKARKATVGEAALHRAVADLLDWILVPPVLWTTFPAGWGKLSKAMAGQLYGSGLKAGMPDILIFAPRKVIGIELKAPGRSQTVVQRDMTAKLHAAGVRVFVCHNVNEVLMALGIADVPRRQVHL